MTETPVEERARLLAEGDAAWAELCAALDAALPDAVLHDPGSAAWTSRDVYTHFMRMHMRSADVVRRELAGLPLDLSGETEDEVNARLQAEESGRTLERRTLARAIDARRVPRVDVEPHARAAVDDRSPSLGRPRRRLLSRAHRVHPRT